MTINQQIHHIWQKKHCYLIKKVKQIGKLEYYIIFGKIMHMFQTHYLNRVL